MRNLWKLGWTVVLVSCLCVGLSSAAEKLPPPKMDDSSDETRALNQLRMEISFLNLLNGLNLSEEQLTQLIAVGKEADEMRQGLKTRRQKLMDEAEPSFTQLKAVLAKNGEIPEKLRQRVFGIENAELRLRQDYQSELARLQEKAEKVFTAGQKEMIADFDPCLIPPQHLADPSRIGQANDASVFEKMMSNWREMPKPQFERFKESIAERHVAQADLHLGKMTAEERSKEKARLIALMDKTRSLSDVDFAFQKGELAKQLKPKDEAKDQSKKLDKARQSGYGYSKLGHFFLGHDMLPLLEERLALLKNAPEMKPTDLSTVKGVEACKDGVCGISDLDGRRAKSRH